MLRPFARAPRVKIYRDPPAFRGGSPLLRTCPKVATIVIT